MHGEAKLLLKFLDGSDKPLYHFQFISETMTGSQNNASSFQ